MKSKNTVKNYIIETNRMSITKAKNAMKWCKRGGLSTLQVRVGGPPNHRFPTPTLSKVEPDSDFEMHIFHSDLDLLE